MQMARPQDHEFRNHWVDPKNRIAKQYAATKSALAIKIIYGFNPLLTYVLPVVGRNFGAFTAATKKLFCLFTGTPTGILGSKIHLANIIQQTF